MSKVVPVEAGETADEKPPPLKAEASFITSDDAITAERIQAGIGGTHRSWADDGRGWIDLSRGRHREVRDADGVLAGDLSDETTNRGFWLRYLEVMEERAPA